MFLSSLSVFICFSIHVASFSAMSSWVADVVFILAVSNKSTFALKYAKVLGKCQLEEAVTQVSGHLR